MPATIRKGIKKRKTLKMRKRSKYDPSAKYLLNKYLLIKRSMMPGRVMRPMRIQSGPIRVSALSKLLPKPRNSMTESAFMRLKRSMSKSRGKVKRRNSYRR